MRYPSVMAKDLSLVEQIQSDALDGGARIADALRKCVALGGRAGSAELRDWATRELRGYEDGTDLPDYRTVVAPIVIDGMTGNQQFTRMQISTHDLPEPARGKIDETLELRSGIGQLEELVTHARASGQPIRIGLHGGSTLAKLMTHERGYFVERVYWNVSPTAVVGVIDQVRTRLVELSAEIMAEAGRTGDPSPQAVQNAVNVVVHGSRARVNLNAAQSSGGGGSASIAPALAGDRPWWRRAKTIWGLAIGLVTIAGAVLAWLQWK